VFFGDCVCRAVTGEVLALGTAVIGSAVFFPPKQLFLADCVSGFPSALIAAAVYLRYRQLLVNVPRPGAAPHVSAGMTACDSSESRDSLLRKATPLPSWAFPRQPLVEEGDIACSRLDNFHWSWSQERAGEARYGWVPELRLLRASEGSPRVSFPRLILMWLIVLNRLALTPDRPGASPLTALEVYVFGGAPFCFHAIRR